MEAVGCLVKYSLIMQDINIITETKQNITS